MSVDGASSAANSESEELSPSEIHDVLRNDRRRLVLERLRTTDGPETVSELAEHIGAIEADESPPPRNVRQSVYVSLHQTHLPKLDELGIVDYDPDGKTVRAAENASEVDVYMEVVPRYSISRAEYYLGLGLLGGLLFLANVVGVPVVRAIDPIVVGFALSAVLVISALHQLYVQGSSLLHRLRDE